MASYKRYPAISFVKCHLAWHTKSHIHTHETSVVRQPLFRRHVYKTCCTLLQPGPAWNAGQNASISRMNWRRSVNKGMPKTLQLMPNVYMAGSAHFAHTAQETTHTHTHTHPSKLCSDTCGHCVAARFVLFSNNARTNMQSAHKLPLRATQTRKYLDLTPVTPLTFCHLHKLRVRLSITALCMCHAKRKHLHSRFFMRHAWHGNAIGTILPDQLPISISVPLHLQLRCFGRSAVSQCSSRYCVLGFVWVRPNWHCLLGQMDDLTLTNNRALFNRHTPNSHLLG